MWKEKRFLKLCKRHANALSTAEWRRSHVSSWRRVQVEMLFVQANIWDMWELCISWRIPEFIFSRKIGLTSLVRKYSKLCIVTYLMKVWKIVQRAVFDRAVCEVVGSWLQSWDRAPGWSWNAAAGGDDGGCLCGPQRSVLRRALPGALEVQGFNECFMLNLEPALFTV